MEAAPATLRGSCGSWSCPRPDTPLTCPCAQEGLSVSTCWDGLRSPRVYFGRWLCYSRSRKPTRRLISPLPHPDRPARSATPRAAGSQGRWVCAPRAPASARPLLVLPASVAPGPQVALSVPSVRTATSGRAGARRSLPPPRPARGHCLECENGKSCPKAPCSFPSPARPPAVPARLRHPHLLPRPLSPHGIHTPGRSGGRRARLAGLALPLAVACC